MRAVMMGAVMFHSYKDMLLSKETFIEDNWLNILDDKLRGRSLEHVSKDEIDALMDHAYAERKYTFDDFKLTLEAALKWPIYLFTAIFLSYGGQPSMIRFYRYFTVAIVAIVLATAAYFWWSHVSQ